MNNNGEHINRYNEILLKYLNDLVNGIDPKNQLMMELIESVSNNFKKQLEEVNLDIAEDGVKTLLANALNEYIKILKYHFDHSNIHKIDISHSNNEDINFEVNQITNNLASAVNSINKIPEYKNLVDRIKVTLVNYFVQTFPNKENVRDISDKIISDCIISCLNNLSVSKIDEFNTNTLPTLISIGDNIVYVREITQEDIEEANLRVNDERDAFIYENMDVEIKEGFENGVVTLDVTDSMGKTMHYVGREAMEKLVSYNQLFEASRPGKRADISKWEHLLIKMYEEDASGEEQFKTRSNNINEGNNVKENFSSDLNTPVDSIVDAPTAVDNTGVDINRFSNNLIKDIATNPVNTEAYNVTVNNTNNEMTETTEADEPFSRMKNTSLEVSTSSNANGIDMNIDATSSTTTENEQMIKNFLSNYDINNNNNDNNFVTPNNTYSTPSKLEFVQEESKEANFDVSPMSNTLASSTFNDMINATQKVEEPKEIKSVMETKEKVNVNNKSIYSGNFSFIPNFDNPNQDRDDFIKKATGILIEEDVDNQGNLYLKVTEPTGREQVYTGKEAINMIKNYNRTYLDANPGKRVDTSLIDKFE